LVSTTATSAQVELLALWAATATQPTGSQTINLNNATTYEYPNYFLHPLLRQLTFTNANGSNSTIFIGSPYNGYRVTISPVGNGVTISDGFQGANDITVNGGTSTTIWWNGTIWVEV
jgi:hypothetical protein